MKYLLILVAVVCLLVVKEADALKCVGHPHIYSAVGSTSLVSFHSFSLSSLSSLSSSPVLLEILLTFFKLLYNETCC